MQLAETSDGALVWTGSFSGGSSDAVRLQSEIAEGALRAVEQRLLLGRIPSSGLWTQLADPLRHRVGLGHWSVQASTVKAEAYDLYLQARYLLEERTVPAPA